MTAVSTMHHYKRGLSVPCALHMAVVRNMTRERKCSSASAGPYMASRCERTDVTQLRKMNTENSDRLIYDLTSPKLVSPQHTVRMQAQKGARNLEFRWEMYSVCVRRTPHMTPDVSDHTCMVGFSVAHVAMISFDRYGKLDCRFLPCGLITATGRPMVAISCAPA